MAKNSDNVRVGYAGSVYVGLVGATAPVNPTAAWDPADWTELGHISEDGITEQSSRDTAEFKAWGFPNSPVRIQTTSQEFSFQVTFLETSHHILSLFHGIDLDDFTSTASAGGVPQFLKANKAPRRARRNALWASTSSTARTFSGSSCRRLRSPRPVTCRTRRMRWSSTR